MYVLQLVEYERLIYLDGDIQVFGNIDHLFEYPKGYIYAVMDCFCERTWQGTPQYEIGYCQQCPEKVEWPAEMGPPPPLYFNAGMFVFEPSLETYGRLVHALQQTPPTSFAEQDFLNMFFRDIYRPIPSEYNLVLAMLWRHPQNVDLDSVKVVHYCAEVSIINTYMHNSDFVDKFHCIALQGAKPWRFTGKEENMEREDIEMVVKKWWEIYEDESLDYSPKAVQFVAAPSAATA